MAYTHVCLLLSAHSWENKSRELSLRLYPAQAADLVHFMLASSRFGTQFYVTFLCFISRVPVQIMIILVIVLVSILYTLLTRYLAMGVTSWLGYLLAL